MKVIRMLLILLLPSTLILSGCNTVRGAGTDLQASSDAVSKSFEHHNKSYQEPTSSRTGRH